MYEEENRNLSENPTPEHGAGTDAVNTEHTESSAVENGAESNVTESNVTENNAAESTDTESSSTESQYRYTGPFYEDTIIRERRRRRESTAHAETRKPPAERKKERLWPYHREDRVHRVDIRRGGRCGLQGTNFVGQKLFGDKVTAADSRDTADVTDNSTVSDGQPQNQRPTAAPVRRTTPLPYPPL